MLQNFPIKTTTENHSSLQTTQASTSASDTQAQAPKTPAANQGPTLADVRRLLGEHLGITGEFFQRMAHFPKPATPSEPTPLTPRTLALHQNVWAERIAAAQKLKSEALALQGEALAKLQEARTLLAAASVTPTLSQAHRDAAHASVRSCDESMQRVREEMPPVNGIAAFAKLSSRADITDAPASRIATQSLASGDGTWLEDYDLVEDAADSWAIKS